MQPILLFGATGFLGQTFCPQPSPDWIVVGRERFDFRQPPRPDFLNFLETTSARTAVVAAAMSSPDDCLRQPELSEQVNGAGMIELFTALKKFHIKPVFISSDHVFNGVQGQFGEDDPYSPVTLYGRQKVRAETHLREHHKDFLILRTSKQLAMRVDKKNMLSEMAAQLRNGQDIRCATDSWLTPSFVEDIVAMTKQALATDLCGVFHIAPKGELTRFELGRQIAAAFHQPESRVQACSMLDFKFPEVRPPRCTLDGSRLRDLLSFPMTELSDGLARLKAIMG